MIIARDGGNPAPRCADPGSPGGFDDFDRCGVSGVWQEHALSALAGGLIGLIANACMTLTALRSTASAAGALGRLMVGQMVKVVLTVGLLLIVAQGQMGQLAAAALRLRSDAGGVLVRAVLSMRTRRPKRLKTGCPPRGTTNDDGCRTRRGTRGTFRHRLHQPSHDPSEGGRRLLGHSTWIRW